MPGFVELLFWFIDKKVEKRPVFFNLVLVLCPQKQKTCKRDPQWY